MSKSAGQWVGTIAGGVIGSFFGMTALGASLGGMVGGMIDPPKGPSVTGPRLEDQGFTSSTLGAALARGYGTFPVSGNVIWLEGDKYREVTTTKSQGGKGGGGGSEVTSYTYYATFAVSLLRVTYPSQTVALRRLWIGSNLVFDAGSDNLQSIIASNNGQGINFTFYSGSDDQAPNPRWQADKGVNAVSGFPGRCYIVIEDLDLTKYGNSLAMAQIKAELVVRAQASPQHTELVEMFENSDGTTFSWLGSARYDGQYVVATVQRWLASNYDCVDVQRISYDTFTGTKTLNSATLPSYPDLTFETKLNCPVNQSDTDIIALIKYRVSNDGTRLYIHDSAGALLLDTGWLAQSVLPYDGYTVAYVKGEVFLAKNARKIYKVSQNTLGEVAVISTAASTSGQSIGVSDSYVFAAQFNNASASLTVYVYARANLAAVTSYTLANHGKYASISVISDREFYTRSQETNGKTWHWLNGVATETGMVFPDGDTYGWDRFFAISSSLFYTLHYAESGDTDWHLYAEYIKVPPALASLRDIVTSECSLAGVAAADLDLTALTDHDVRGYRITERGSIRSALEPLQARFPFDVAHSGYKLRFVSRGGTSLATIPEGDLGTVAGNEKPATLLAVEREMDTQLPRKVSVKYLDVDREYDLGEQYAERPAPNSVNERALELPLVMNSSEVAQTADVLLSKEWVERVDFGPFSLPPVWRHLEAADVVTVEHRGQANTVRLTRAEYLPDGRITCNAKLTSAQSYTSTATGETPAVLGQSLVPLRGTTTAYLLDIPRIRAKQDVPGMAFGLLGGASGWPGGALLCSDDFENSWLTVGAMNARARVFTASGTLGAASPYHLDPSVLTVTALTPNAALYGVTEAQCYGHANMAAYGADGRWEIVSFMAVTDNTGSFTLSGFLRGLYGSEMHTGSHAANDLLVMLDTATVGFFGLPTTAIGAERAYRAVTQGLNLDSAPTALDTYEANNLKPLAPVDINGHRDSTTLDWKIKAQRRTRWPVEVFSGATVPVGETAESYVCEIWDSAYTTLKRTLAAATLEFDYLSAQQIADFGSERDTVYTKIYQLSSVVGRGWPLTTSMYRAIDDDIYRAYVRLLMHMNDAALSDVKGHAVSLFGNAARSSTQSKWGGYALYLDGSGDYLTLADSADWNFVSSAVTIEFWFYETAAGTDRQIIGQHTTLSNANSSFIITSSSQKLQFICYSGATPYSIIAPSTHSLNTWHHGACVRDGSNMHIYLDGTRIATSTAIGVNALNNSTMPITLGVVMRDTLPDPVNFYYTGYLDDIRITNAARYTGTTYTVPTAEFPNP